MYVLRLCYLAYKFAAARSGDPNFPAGAMFRVPLQLVGQKVKGRPGESKTQPPRPIPNYFYSPSFSTAAPLTPTSLFPQQRPLITHETRARERKRESPPSAAAAAAAAVHVQTRCVRCGVVLGYPWVQGQLRKDNASEPAKEEGETQETREPTKVGLVCDPAPHAPDAFRARNAVKILGLAYINKQGTSKRAFLDAVALDFVVDPWVLRSKPTTRSCSLARGVVGGRVVSLSITKQGCRQY